MYLFLGGRQPRRGKRSVSRPIASSCSCSSPPSRSPSANQRCRTHCAPTTPLCTPCRTSNPGPRTGNRAQTLSDQYAVSVRKENFDLANMTFSDPWNGHRHVWTRNTVVWVDETTPERWVMPLLKQRKIVTLIFQPANSEIPTRRQDWCSPLYAFTYSFY